MAKTAARRAAVIEARSLAARRPWEVASSAPAFDGQQGDVVVELPSDVALASANAAAAELRLGWSVPATRATLS